MEYMSYFSNLLKCAGREMVHISYGIFPIDLDFFLSFDFVLITYEWASIWKKLP